MSYYDVARPQIITHPVNKLVEVNNDSTNVQFRCMAEGATSYFWQRRGRNNFPAGATELQTNILTINNLIPPDAGQYRCVAVNEHGRNFSIYAMLRIKGKYNFYNSFICLYSTVFSFMYKPAHIAVLYSLLHNSSPSCGDHHTINSKC